MAEFIYKAKAGPQKVIDGVVNAKNLDEAVAKIITLGYTPIDVTDRKKVKGSVQKRSIPSIGAIRKRVSNKDVMLFTRQACDLIDAGVPVLRCLSIIEKQTRTPHFKAIVHQMYTFVLDGGAFSDALGKHTDVFSKLYVNMVRSGELGGNLDLVLNRLADFLERDFEIRSQIRTSLIYPTLILVVGCVTIFILFTWVIPRITAIYDDVSETLPLATQILVGVSSFLSHFWWMVIGAVVLAAAYVERIRHTDNGKLALDQFKLRVPFFGEFIKNAEVGKFARTLGTLLENGVVIVSALEAVILIMDNEVFKGDLRRISDDVARGKSLTEGLRSSSLFSEAAINMIAVGEESGNMSKGLAKLAHYHERLCHRFMEGVTSLIEPVLILLVGTIVGFIVLSMLMPIFRMNLIIQ